MDFGVFNRGKIRQRVLRFWPLIIVFTFHISGLKTTVHNLVKIHSYFVWPGEKSDKHK